jgi:hypothetical protein
MTHPSGLPLVQTPILRANGNAHVSDDVGKTWVTDDLRARRRADALLFTELVDGQRRKYEGEIQEMIERGVVEVQPEADRVLTCAVLAGDAHDTKLWQPEYDSRDAVAHRVLAIGPGVRAFEDRHGYSEAERLKVGDYVWILATVADRMSARDKTCRLWTTRREHISLRFTPKAG